MEWARWGVVSCLALSLRQQAQQRCSQVNNGGKKHEVFWDHDGSPFALILGSDACPGDKIVSRENPRHPHPAVGQSDSRAAMTALLSKWAEVSESTC